LESAQTAKIARLSNQVNVLHQDVEVLRSEKSRLETDLRGCNDQLVQFKERVRILSRELQDSQKSAKELENRFKTHIEKLKESSPSVDDYASMYVFAFHLLSFFFKAA
jgi:chromosome segregation ATPase